MPDLNRVGILTAVILLAFALTQLFPAPQFHLRLALPGFYFALPLGLGAAMTLLATGLAATGMDWLLRAHPALGKKPTIEHWLVPTLTTFVIGVSLALLPSGPVWWTGFAVGAALLALVFLAEYVAVDPAAASYAAATAGLTALSFAIYLILIAALRLAGVRLFLLVPASFLTAGLISLRTLHLRLSGRWEFAWAGGIALVCTQLAAGLHYWPVSPVQFGLALLGPLYALTSLAAALLEGTQLRRAWVEPAAALGLAWAAAVLIR